MNDQITPQEFLDTNGAGGWRVLGDGASVHFSTRSLAEGAALLDAIASLDGIDDHPPALDIRRGGITLRLVTFATDYGGMTRRDADLAARISVAASDLGLMPDPGGVQSLLIIPGAPDITKVMPFWRAVLGYEPRVDSPDEDLVDPQDRGTPFWFERMDEPRAGGGGAIHIAVWVPFEHAEARIAAALAAGGHMVRDAHAPSWWTLADTAGNEVDIATTSGRAY